MTPASVAAEPSRPGEAETAVPVDDAPAVPAPPVALYVHVPFCVSVCPYCDFVVYAGAAARGPRNRVAALVDALAAELELRADGLDAAFGPPGSPGRPGLASVYLGGGTPSLLPPDALARLLDLVRRRFGVAPDAEVTIEANPGPDERGDAGALAALGVNRLSLGAQRLDATSLRALGRRHGPEDGAEAVAAARAAGIASVGLDLLYDVPGTTLDDWWRTVAAALALRPDHLSLYALTLDDPDAEGLTGAAGDHLPVRPGARRWRARARLGQDEDRAAAEYEYAVEVLAAAGYRGYEISNWARSGHESTHNRAYWAQRPWEAVGPGAHAFDGRTRRWNAARLEPYVAALTAGRLPPGGTETPDAGTRESERLVLALRTDRGVPLAATVRPPLADIWPWAAAAGLVEATEDGRGVLTTRGRLVSNELFARLV